MKDEIYLKLQNPQCKIVSANIMSFNDKFKLNVYRRPFGKK
jgi:hypothetical protein